MRRLLTILFLSASCASTKPVTPPPVVTPPVVTPPIHGPSADPDTVYLPSKPDTLRTVDTFTQFEHDTTTIKVPTILSLPDTSVQEITLTPSGGDDWPQVQAAINYNIKHHLYWINCTAGFFRFYEPPVIADTTGGTYHQVSIGLRGICPAKNTPVGWQTNFTAYYANTFGIGMQLCKGCTVENIAFTGQYNKSSTFNEVQIDTLTFAEWADGICSTNNNSPYAGIVVDPFSNPAYYTGISSMYQGLESYYLPGMNESGSTAVQIKSCSFGNYIAAFIIAPGWQENGEEIDVIDCGIQNCRSGICPTNAQQKSNHVTRLQVWGGVHTLIDCARYGADRGDGTIFPVVDGVNIAGFNHEFLRYFAGSHPGGAAHVYAESLYKIGYSGGPAGFNFDNCQFNLQLPDAGVPFPDFVYNGSTTTWTNTEIRVYGDSMRIVLNTPGNIFKNGQITNPPVCLNLEIPVGPTSVTRYPPPTIFDHVSMFYTGAFLSGNDYDSIVLMTIAGSSLGTPVQLVVNADFTGYFISSATPSPGDLLLTQHVYGDDYLPGEGPNWTGEYPVGVVTSVIGDTVNLRHIGQGIHTGDQLIVYDVKIKSS